MQDGNSISRERLYYRIGEVSRITGLKPHVLRYWESEFKVIKPYKGGSLQRLYRKKDLDLILKIKRLLYEEGFTIAGAKRKIRDIERERDEEMKLKFRQYWTVEFDNYPVSDHYVKVKDPITVKASV